MSKLKRGDTSDLVEKLLESNPSLMHESPNIFILAVWESHGLKSMIGGVAFALIRHFIKTAPNAATVLRVRRNLLEEDK